MKKSDKYQKISWHVGEKEKYWKKAKKYKKRKDVFIAGVIISFFIVSISFWFLILLGIFFIPLVYYSKKYERAKDKAEM